MREGRAFRWQQLLVLGCVCALLVPGWAQQAKLPEEMLLNNVSLNSTYVEVLKRRGIPHFIGPSVSGMSAVTALLRPAEPKQAMGAPARPNIPGAPAYSPAAPAYSPAAPTGVYAPNSAYGPSTTVPLAPPRPEKTGPYMIWRYDGNSTTGKADPKAAVTTYVFFNERGVVDAVVVNQNNPKGINNIQTESGITFGTKLSDIVKKYDWPEPFTRVGSFYYCNYPAYNVTFALDTESRKVSCISIGVPFIVTAQTLEAGEQAKVAPGAGTPGGLQPLPVMPPSAYMGGEGRSDYGVPDAFGPEGFGPPTGFGPPPGYRPPGAPLQYGN